MLLQLPRHISALFKRSMRHRCLISYVITFWRLLSGKWHVAQCCVRCCSGCCWLFAAVALKHLYYRTRKSQEYLRKRMDADFHESQASTLARLAQLEARDAMHKAHAARC